MTDEAFIGDLITTWAGAAGQDVALAHALLRCGKPEDFAAEPDNRLRMTIGLRKIDGLWRVTHEHHSFPST